MVFRNAPWGVKVCIVSFCAIQHHHVAAGVERDGPWLHELARTGALRAEVQQLVPGLVELDDAVVPGIHDIDVPRAIHGHAARLEQAAVGADAQRDRGRYGRPK